MEVSGVLLAVDGNNFQLLGAVLGPLPGVLVHLSNKKGPWEIAHMLCLSLTPLSETTPREALCFLVAPVASQA